MQVRFFEVCLTVWCTPSVSVDAVWVSFMLTLSWRRFLSYRNQSIDLLSKSVDWFLYDRNLRHERVNFQPIQHNMQHIGLVFLFPLLSIYLLAGQLSFSTTSSWRISLKKFPPCKITKTIRIDSVIATVTVECLNDHMIQHS